MKTNNNSSAPAFSSEKDNKTTKTSAALAKAWLAKHRKPNCLKTSHVFDLLLDEAIKCYKPDGSMNELLRDFEDEVRQRAANLLFRSYFAGNCDLTAATDAGELEKVRMYLAQAILGALERCEFEILRREARIAKWHHLTDEIDYFEKETNIHPCARKSLWELPVEIQLQLVYAGLGLAVRENNMPIETATMIRTMIKENCSVSDIARRIKISPQAAHKRIKRAGAYLKKFIDDCEFPS